MRDVLVIKPAGQALSLSSIHGPGIFDDRSGVFHQRPAAFESRLLTVAEPKEAPCWDLERSARLPTLPGQVSNSDSRSGAWRLRDFGVPVSVGRPSQSWFVLWGASSCTRLSWLGWKQTKQFLGECLFT